MLKQFLPQLSSEAQALLAKERALPVEDEALRQRVLERARTALEADRPSGVSLRLAGGSDAAHAGRARLRRTVLLMAAAVAVAGLAAAGAGIFENRKPEAPSVQGAAPASPGSVVRVAPKPVVAIAAEPPPNTDAPPAEPHPAPAAPTESSRAPNASSYALELQLLEPARSSIARGDFGGALSAIQRHQREYPHGQLAEEREALRVRALWGSGQKAAAESAAAVFRKRYPRSGLLSWMKGAVTPP
jgi:hypothetical protein